MYVTVADSSSNDLWLAGNGEGGVCGVAMAWKWSVWRGNNDEMAAMANSNGEIMKVTMKHGVEKRENIVISFLK